MNTVMAPEAAPSHEVYFALEQTEDARYEYLAGEVFARAGKIALPLLDIRLRLAEAYRQVEFPSPMTATGSVAAVESNSVHPNAASGID